MSLPTPEELTKIQANLRPVLGDIVDNPKFPKACEQIAIGGDPDPRDFGITGQSRGFFGKPGKDRWFIGSEFLGEGTPEAVIARLTAGNWFAAFNRKLASL